jgi:peptidoglycan/LPS O-acetylase OafA/YrhL
MPVIIGLYFSFPVLNKILEKLGILAMLLISAFITYGTLTIVALATAFRGEHASDLFTFWMIQFALGIALAYMRKTNPPKLRVLIGVKPFFIGAGLLMCSWALRTYVPLGKVFNDPITSIGIFLLLLNLVWTFRKVRGTAKILISLSNKSYLMYLIHYPIMKFLIGPPLRGFTNPLIVVALGSLYVLAIFSVCSLISKPINGISSWIYYKDQA